MHYFLENQSEEIRQKAEKREFTGPEFVGQGCTQQVGSDSYGYFVIEIIKPGRLAGLVRADSAFIGSWTEGSMTSKLPADAVFKTMASEPAGPHSEFDYIGRYGKNWYWCDVIDGKIRRRRGSHARLSFNGAYSYRDPSF